MNKQFPHARRGYIALMSAVIISLILIGMTFTLASGGYFSRFNALNNEYKKISLGLAESCANMALLEVANNFNYVPPLNGSTTMVGLEQCLIKSVHYGPTDSATHRRTAFIASQGVYRGAYSNINVAATVADPTYSSYSRATLVVITHVVNDSGGTKTAGDFTMNLGPLGLNPSQSTFAGAEAGVTVVLDAGIYSVGASGPAGYTQSSVGCSGLIVVGETKTCTIVENDVSSSATLTVVANIKNDNAGTKGPADFPLYIDGVAVVPGQANVVTAGTHVVSGSAPGDYNASSWGYDCDASGSVTLVSGNAKTCKINYDDIAPPSLGCADTVMMFDRSGSMSNTDLANERAAATALLNIYAKVVPPSAVSIGSFGGLYGGASAQIPNGSLAQPATSTLTTSYGNDIGVASTSLLFPSALHTPSGWNSPSNAFGQDGLWATSSVVNQQQGYAQFSIPSVPSGSTISGIEVELSGFAVASPQVGGATLTPNAVGNFNTISWTTQTNSTSNTNKINAVNDNSTATYDTATASSSQSFKVNTSTIPAGATITSVRLDVSLQKTNSGSPVAYMLIERGTTAGNYRMNAVSGVTANTWTTYSTTTLVDPFTGGAWSTTSLASYGFGVAKNSSGQIKVAQVNVVVSYIYTPPASGQVGVNLSWNNGTSWTSPARAGTFTGVSATTSVSTSTDKWGRTWSANELSNANFVLRVQHNAAAGIVLHLNYATVRVYYTQPATGLYSALRLMTGSNSGVGTDIASAINVANAELGSARHIATNEKVLILVSDGEPSKPSGNLANDTTATLLAASTTKHAGGVHIFTVRYSADSNAAGIKLMKDISTASSTDYFPNPAPTAAQMAAIFQTIGATVCPAAGAVAVLPPTHASIYVVTHVVNDNGGAKKAEDFTMNITAVNPSLATFLGTTSPGVLVSVDPGAYSIGEASIGGYTQSFDSNCDSANVGVGAILGGDTRLCTVTNDDIPLPPPPPPPPPPDIDIGPWQEATTTSAGP